MEHEETEFVAWATQDDARLSAAEDDDWHEDEDGRLLCLECRHKPRGDLFELAQEDNEEEDEDG